MIKPRKDGDPKSADPFRPPAVPTEVCCLHCEQTYSSDLIQWIEEKIDGVTVGFWCCPIPGCDGKGFDFDIFPTDPDYVNEHGDNLCSWDDDDDDEFMDI